MIEAERQAEEVEVIYWSDVPGPRSQRKETVHESVAEALHFACQDLRRRQARPLAILARGAVVLDAEAIMQEYRKRGAHQ